MKLEAFEELIDEAHLNLTAGNEWGWGMKCMGICWALIPYRSGKCAHTVYDLRSNKLRKVINPESGAFYWTPDSSNLGVRYIALELFRCYMIDSGEYKKFKQFKINQYYQGLARSEQAPLHTNLELQLHRLIQRGDSQH